ncbi:MAG: hypothetical protein GOV15_02290 [Candidatus Diapherotrites archaeon]|nr:hypothetical protein [Candidatus Diapherotrites archaeon]
MSEAEAEKIVKILEFRKVQFKVTNHEPVTTSEEASKVRGVPIESGIKAMILKGKSGRFIAAMLSANFRIDLKALSAEFGERLSFARESEVLEVTGCERGSVPPFGWKTNLPIFFDKRVFDQDEVNFNIGLKTRSITMKASDLKAVLPTAKVLDFAVTG